MPRVSIVLTCYNHLRHLQQAVECVRAQTYKDYEVIALDDGSTDGTREWLSTLHSDVPSCPFKFVFNETNLGTYATLNKGIGLASGEFIAELNDDDLWAPEKLERQVAMMDARPEVGLVHTGGWFIDDEGNRIDINPLGFEWPVTDVASARGRREPRSIDGDPLHELALYNRVIASSVLVRRECFDKVGLFNPNYFGSGDWEMWFRIAEQYDFGHLSEPLTFYRVHSGSASHHKVKIAIDDLKIREWMLPRILSNHRSRWSESDLKWMVAHQWACIGSGRIHAGDRRGGRAAFVSSLTARPTRFKSAVRYLASFLPNRAFRALD